MDDEILVKAMAAGARAFADALEAGVAPKAVPSFTVVPTPSRAESMKILLKRVLEVNNQGRGITASEMRRFAREAGIDPRGTAGYYAAGLLVTRGNERWITEAGKTRLNRLQEGVA